MTTSTVQSHLNKVRKDKFVAILSLPNILKTLQTHGARTENLINLDSLQFSLYNFSVPKIAIPEIPMHFGQQNFNVTSYDRPAYNPVTLNFEVDNEFKNYWVLWKWLMLLNDIDTAEYAGKKVYPNDQYKLDKQPDIKYDYVTEILVQGLDEYNNARIKFKYEYAFITELGELDYNYRDSDQLSCSFTFAFNRLDINLA